MRKLSILLVSVFLFTSVMSGSAFSGDKSHKQAKKHFVKKKAKKAKQVKADPSVAAPADGAGKLK